MKKKTTTAVIIAAILLLLLSAAYLFFSIISRPVYHPVPVNPFMAYGVNLSDGSAYIPASDGEVSIVCPC